MLVGLWLLAACAPIQLTRPVFKLGLLAPFEGKGRASGYEALYAAKLALQERNATGGIAGWSAELVALDDGDDFAQTIQQARVLAADPDVMRMLVVIPSNEMQRANTRLVSLGLAFDMVAPQATDGNTANSAAFIAAYHSISGGITPGALAAQTYTMTQSALAQIEQRIRAQGHPSR